MLARLVLLFTGLLCIDLTGADTASAVNTFFKVMINNNGYIYGNITAEWNLVNPPPATGATTDPQKVDIKFHELKKLFKDDLTFGLKYHKADSATEESFFDVCTNDKAPNIECTATFNHLITAAEAGNIEVVVKVGARTTAETGAVIQLPYVGKEFTVKPECEKTSPLGATQPASQCVCPLIANIGTQCSAFKSEACNSMTNLNNNELTYTIPSIRFDIGTQTFNPTTPDSTYVHNELFATKYYTLTYVNVGGSTPSDDRPFYLDIKVGKSVLDPPTIVLNAPKSMNINFEPTTITHFRNAVCSKKANLITCFCCDQTPGQKPANECLYGITTTTTTTTSPTTTTTIAPAAPGDTTTTTTTMKPDNTTNGAATQFGTLFWIPCTLFGLYFW